MADDLSTATLPQYSVPGPQVLPTLPSCRLESRDKAETACRRLLVLSSSGCYIVSLALN